MYIPFSFFSNTTQGFYGKVDYLILGGGGAGGENAGGGGGGGGFISGSGFLLPNTSYPVVTAWGGKRYGTFAASATSGSWSYFVNTFSSGGAAGGPFATNGQNAISASGGGGGARTYPNTTNGGTGLIPYGNNGGGGLGANAGTVGSGGGGGANQVGQNAYVILLYAYSGVGGDGRAWVDGNDYCGGGGGVGVLGGSGGGGTGGQGGGTGSAGQANTGAGGGGGSGGGSADQGGGNGGTGVVKVRYTGSPKAVGGSVVFDGTFTTHTFSETGSNTLTTFAYDTLSGSTYIVPGPAPIAPPYYEPLPTGGLVLYNEWQNITGSTWTDSSGNGNDGLISGSTLTSASAYLGVFFNGTDNYVTYPQPLIAEPSSSWTLVLQSRLNNFQSPKDLFCKDNYSDGWDLLFASGNFTTTNPSFRYRDVAGSDKVASSRQIAALDTQVYTMTFDATTDIAKLYYNGVFLVNFSSGQINNFNVSSLPLKFGYNTNTDANIFQGYVKNILVYNKVLTADEIVLVNLSLSNKA